MIAIITNEEKKDAKDLFDRIRSWYESRGIPVATRIEDLDEQVEFLIVLGGDGTILSTARKIYPLEIPIIGVNLGRLGFLTSTESHALEGYLEKTLDITAYDIEERIMLDVEVLDDGRSVFRDIALNDIVLSRSSLEGMLAFTVTVSGTRVDDFFADGYIVSTPTGSTAYSLSAGGPILTPRMDAILLTPICAHTLYARPIVVEGSEAVEILLNSEGRENIITIDGQRRCNLSHKGRILIRKSPVRTRTVRFRDRAFFEVLGEKIGKRR